MIQIWPKGECVSQRFQFLVFLFSLIQRKSVLSVYNDSDLLFIDGLSYSSRHNWPNKSQDPLQ